MYQKVHMPSTRPQRLVAVVEKTQAMRYGYGNKNDASN